MGRYNERIADAMEDMSPDGREFFAESCSEGSYTDTLDGSLRLKRFESGFDPGKTIFVKMTGTEGFTVYAFEMPEEEILELIDAVNVSDVMNA